MLCVTRCDERATTRANTNSVRSERGAQSRGRSRRYGKAKQAEKNEGEEDEEEEEEEVGLSNGAAVLFCVLFCLAASGAKGCFGNQAGQGSEWPLIAPHGPGGAMAAVGPASEIAKQGQSPPSWSLETAPVETRVSCFGHTHTCEPRDYGCSLTLTSHALRSLC